MEFLFLILLIPVFLGVSLLALQGAELISNTINFFSEKIEFKKERKLQKKKKQLILCIDGKCKEHALVDSSNMKDWIEFLRILKKENFQNADLTCIDELSDGSFKFYFKTKLR